MKHTFAFLLLVTVILSACAPVVAPTLVPETSGVLLPTDTSEPTATSTSTPTVTPTGEPTPTPIPTLSPELVGGLEGVPDPRFTNPELFDLTNPDAPIPQFVNAMELAGIEVTGEQVAQGLTYQQLKDRNGNPFIVAIYNLNPDPSKTGETLEDPIPLLIWTKEGWREATLSELGKTKDILMGAFYGGNNLGSGDFERIANIMKKEFSLGGIWIGMSDTQPIEGNFNLLNLKLIERGLAPLYHPLIWFDSAPDWIKNKSGQALIDAINYHIAKIVRNIESIFEGNPNKSQEPILVVVNEANHSRDFFYSKLGFLYLESAFRTARENSPSSILIYNDYSNYTLYGERYKNTKIIVDQLKSMGLIDGVGVQLVITDGSFPPKKEDIITALQSYGLPVYITEFSVNMRNVNGSNEERFKIQAGIYQTIMEAAIESGVCRAFVDFQLGDRFSVWENLQLLPFYSKYADPTPYDDNLKPKPALYAQRAAFLQNN